MKNQKLELLIIGWDGASFSYLQPWLDAGAMPTLSRILEKAAYGTLKSIMPPQTPVAWPCITTGLNPGKLGIYGWWFPDFKDYSPVPVTGSSIRAKRIWDYVGQAGRSVGVVNVPLSHPPRSLNGFMIAGFDSVFSQTAFDSAIVYPPELFEQLRDAKINYKVLITERHGGFPDYSHLLDAWIEMERTRADTVVNLAKTRQPAFLMVQHHIGDYFHHRASRLSPLLRRAYECLDECLERYLAICDQDTTILLISDHGAIELEYFVFIHNVLEQKGLLQYHDIAAEDRLIQSLSLLMGRAQIDAEWTQQLLKLWRELPLESRRQLTSFLRQVFPGITRSYDNIDWSKTVAFSLSNYGQIHINAADRFEQGIVQPGEMYEGVVNDVRDAMLGLRNPDTGEGIVSQVIHREELYSGSFVQQAPDLTCILRDYRHYFMMSHSEYLEHNDVIRPVKLHKTDIEHNDRGDHDDNGILIMAGPSARAQHLENPMSVLDVTPTALYLMGLPLSKELDGRVLYELFDKLTPERAVTSDDMVLYETPSTGKEKEFQSGEADDVHRVLRELGYRIR